MPLHTTVDRYSFEQGFKDKGRDYYSTAGYDYLYETLDELDAEFDVIVICCDFTEYGDGEALLYDYGYILDEQGKTFADREDKIESLVEDNRDVAYYPVLPNRLTSNGNGTIGPRPRCPRSCAPTPPYS